MIYPLIYEIYIEYNKKIPLRHCYITAVMKIHIVNV